MKKYLCTSESPEGEIRVLRDLKINIFKCLNNLGVAIKFLGDKVLVTLSPKISLILDLLFPIM